MMEEKDVLGVDKPDNQLKPVKRGSKVMVFVVVVIIIMIAAALYNYKY